MTLMAGYSISEERDKSGDSAFTDIIEKILKESGIRGVVVNSRIINIQEEN